jgi:hypothetical protein
MTATIMIAYPCPECEAGQAILPPKIEAAGIVLCASRGRLRIPMKPDAYSKVKPDTYSDFIPDSVPK